MINRNQMRAAAGLLSALSILVCACGTRPSSPTSSTFEHTTTPPVPTSSSLVESTTHSAVSGGNVPAVMVLSSTPNERLAEPTTTMQELIDQGEVVVNEDPTKPCYNADRLVEFFDLYQAKGEGSVDIYQFRATADNVDRYTVLTLGVTRRKTTVTLDTTYDPVDDGERQGAQIATLGSFTCSENRYGHLLVEITGADNSVHQRAFQLQDYEELYPGSTDLAEQYGAYLEPILYTGLLEQTWEGADALIKVGNFPYVFDALAGDRMAEYYDQHWVSEERIYRFPQALVEEVILPHFDLTTRQLRQATAGYNRDQQSYDFPGRPGMEPLYLRIIRANELPNRNENLVDVFYELFDPTTGATNLRGCLKLSLDGQGSYCYLTNEILYDRSDASIGQE